MIEPKYVYNPLTFDISTSKDGILVSSVDIYGQRMQEFLNLKEHVVRDALIEAGWSPPPEEQLNRE